MARKKEELHCSFCGRPKNEANMLISGIEAHICDACVEQAQTIVNEEMRDRKEKTGFKFSLNRNLKPVKIKEYLDEYIIGQNDAKKSTFCCRI